MQLLYTRCKFHGRMSSVKHRASHPRPLELRESQLWYCFQETTIKRLRVSGSWRVASALRGTMTSEPRKTPAELASMDECVIHLFSDGLFTKKGSLSVTQ